MKKVYLILIMASLLVLPATSVNSFFSEVLAQDTGQTTTTTTQQQPAQQTQQPTDQQTQQQQAQQQTQLQQELQQALQGSAIIMWCTPGSATDGMQNGASQQLQLAGVDSSSGSVEVTEGTGCAQALSEVVNAGFNLADVSTLEIEQGENALVYSFVWTGGMQAGTQTGTQTGTQ